MAREYARALAKAAVAQVAEGVGFDALQQGAHEALAELLLQYVGEAGGLAHGYTELAGRAETNVNDVLLAFQDLGVDVQDVIEYAETTEDAPLAHSVPEFPVARRAPGYETFAQKGEEPPPHIPAFLPAFPEEHTYKDTPRFAGHTQDAREQKLAVERARKEAEKALVKLADRVRPADRAPAQPAESRRPAAAAAESNPFLAPPEVEAAPSGEQDTGAGPMDGVEQPQALQSQPTAPWSEASAAEEPGQMLQAPLQLDWTQPAVPRTDLAPSSMGFEDAFAGAAGDARDVGGRRRKLSLKARAAGDPASQRAEQILAAGAHAMGLEEGGDKGR